MKNKPSILIVEDDVALNDAYVTILGMKYENVATAFNGEEALVLVDQNTPDIIFLDLRMPVMDGIGFLEKYQPKMMTVRIAEVFGYEASWIRAFVYKLRFKVQYKLRIIKFMSKNFIFLV